MQGDGPVGQGRADLDDHPAIARTHMAQGRAGAMHRAQVGDLGHPAVFLSGHLGDRGQYRDHGIVDPDLDRTQLRLDARRGLVHRLGVGHVQNAGPGPATGGLDFRPGTLQPGLTPGQQGDAGTLTGKLHSGSPADPGGGSADHHDFVAIRAHRLLQELCNGLEQKTVWTAALFSKKCCADPTGCVRAGLSLAVAQLLDQPLGWVLDYQ